MTDEMSDPTKLPTIPPNRRMSSAEWLSFGTYFYKVPEVWSFNWLQSESAEEAARWVVKEKKVRFWCSKCKASFESIVTPTKCPAGHLALDEPCKIILSHKGYEADVFPFDVGLPPPMHVKVSK